MPKYSRPLSEHIRIAREHKELLLAQLLHYDALKKTGYSWTSVAKKKRKLERANRKANELARELYCVKKEIIEQYPDLEYYFDNVEF